MDAIAKREYVKVQFCCLLSGEYIIETSCADYDEYAALPDAIEYDGLLLGKTGWNSDLCKACYKRSAARFLARKVK